MCIRDRSYSLPGRNRPSWRFGWFNAHQKITAALKYWPTNILKQPPVHTSNNKLFSYKCTADIFSLTSQIQIIYASWQTKRLVKSMHTCRDFNNVIMQFFTRGIHDCQVLNFILVSYLFQLKTAISGISRYHLDTIVQLGLHRHNFAIAIRSVSIHYFEPVHIAVSYTHLQWVFKNWIKNWPENTWAS